MLYASHVTKMHVLSHFCKYSNKRVNVVERFQSYFMVTCRQTHFPLHRVLLHYNFMLSFETDPFQKETEFHTKKIFAPQNVPFDKNSPFKEQCHKYTIKQKRISRFRIRKCNVVGRKGHQEKKPFFE